MKKPIEALELAKILNPLVETINLTYGTATSRMLHFTPLGSSSVSARIQVMDRDADLFSGVIKTILLKGGLCSQKQPPNRTVDPITFQFRKDILSNSNVVRHFNFLTAQVDPYCLRKSLRLQVTLLRAILANPDNILPEVSPGLLLGEEKVWSVSMTRN